MTNKSLLSKVIYGYLGGGSFFDFVVVVAVAILCPVIVRYVIKNIQGENITW
jgi:hypothetical protein